MLSTAHCCCRMHPPPPKPQDPVYTQKPENGKVPGYLQHNKAKIAEERARADALLLAAEQVISLASHVARLQVHGTYLWAHARQSAACCTLSKTAAHAHLHMRESCQDAQRDCAASCTISNFHLSVRVRSLRTPSTCTAQEAVAGSCAR